jgi:hypothetical protein
MKKYNKIALALAIASTLFVGSLSAASLNFRQDYKHDSKSYASRIKIGGSIGNHYFGLEAKLKGKPFSEWESVDKEIDYGYKFKVTDHWLIQPSMPIKFSDDNVTYKPQVRVQYAFDSGVKAKLRYRHEFQEYTDGSGKNSRQKSKVTGNLSYNYENLKFSVDVNYEKGLDGQIYYNNKDSNWDMNLMIGYKESDWTWRPYVEFGNVSVSSKSDDRQLRSRVGFTYSF